MTTLAVPSLHSIAPSHTPRLRMWYLSSYEYTYMITEFTQHLPKSTATEKRPSVATACAKDEAAGVGACGGDVV